MFQKGSGRHLPLSFSLYLCNGKFRSKMESLWKASRPSFERSAWKKSSLWIEACRESERYLTGAGVCTAIPYSRSPTVIASERLYRYPSARSNWRSIKHSFIDFATLVVRARPTPCPPFPPPTSHNPRHPFPSYSSSSFSTFFYLPACSRP